MADSRPADLWKLARLMLLLGVMLTFLVAGSYAWLRYGVPEHPYGAIANDELTLFVGWREPNPFPLLRFYYITASDSPDIPFAGSMGYTTTQHGVQFDTISLSPELVEEARKATEAAESLQSSQKYPVETLPPARAN